LEVLNFLVRNEQIIPSPSYGPDPDIVGAAIVRESPGFSGLSSASAQKGDRHIVVVTILRAGPRPTFARTRFALAFTPLFLSAIQGVLYLIGKIGSD